MGYLLKEALKTLCGVNQWSYAVFWKIAAQNPMLLVLEECYYAPLSRSSGADISGLESSGLAFEDWEKCCVSGAPQNSRAGVLAEDQILSLVNKIILANPVKIIGQGLVGRAAFTANHTWILSDNFTKETHPPEVQNEISEQLSACIKTLAVIPIFTHGVVQFGSSLTIVESMAFVNDVKNLIFQVGCVPGALLSDNYIPKEPLSNLGNFGVSLFDNGSTFASGSSSLEESPHQQSVLTRTSELNQLSHSTVTQLQTNLQANFSTLQTAKMTSNDFKSQDDISSILLKKRSLPLTSQFNKDGGGAVVIPSNPERLLNHQSSFNNRQSGFDGKQSCVGPSSANYSKLGVVGEGILSDSVLQDYVSNGMSLSECLTSQMGTSSSFPFYSGAGDNLLRSLLDPKADILSSAPVVSGSKVPKSDLSHHMASNDSIMQISCDDDMCSQVEVSHMKGKAGNNFSENVCDFDHFMQSNLLPEQSSRPRSSGDDLLDILGSDFKSKLFGNSWNDFINCGSDSSMQNDQKNISMPEYPNAESNIYFVKGGTDHLLDAIVNKMSSSSMQKLDNGVSCGTTLTNVSSSSVANTSPSCTQLKGLEQTQGKLSGLPMSLAELTGIGSVSFKSEKEDTGSYSKTSSLYGSQVSSWVEQGLPNGKQNSGSSKRADEVGKSDRKRLKNGESPRLRPKDRQMIQDRMKELREIVPNGSKLSIDALLERTIKHMLFLQNVTKHADKLKRPAESKIINKDGGVILRDGFEGGRTWACEVGSQNLVCPIIVEDLNPPRQLLVEMLCEERGLFLEIAEIIRGMGLTILKGVMETRNNKIWAQFAVEADRDVTRMEIFLSLVHLLEQTIKCIPSPCTGIDSNLMSLHQVASIPTTGRPL